MPDAPTSDAPRGHGSVTQSIKNLPPAAKWIGGGVLLGVLYVFYKRYKAASSSNSGSAVGTGPLPFDPGSGFSGGGGGGFSGVGPVTTDPQSTKVPVSIPSGETTSPVSAPAPTPPAANTPAALLPPSLRPLIGNPSVNAAVPVANPVPGDTSSVVAGLLGGNPFSYGGSSSEATNLLNQLPSQPVLNMPSLGPAPAGMVATPIYAQGQVIGVHYDPA